MTTLSLDSRQSHAGTFHFDIYGGISACAFAIAMALCLRHGDFSAIPGLLCLAAMTLVAFSVTPPETGSSTGVRGDRANQATYRTHLLCPHCLEQ